MPLSPVRRRGFQALRVMFGWKPLLWAFAGIGVTVALVQLPGGPLWRTLAGIAVGAGTVRVIARQDRRLRDAECLYRRRPRAADLDRAPAPSTARMRRVRRLLIGVGIAEVSLMIGLVAVVWWLRVDDPDVADRLSWWFYLMVFLVLVGLGTGLPQLVRTLRRFPDPAGLPRSRVTVLGFTGQAQAEVVFVPGMFPVAELLVPVPPGVSERTDLPTAFVTPLGWHLGELIPGDVLVCDGELVEGAVVALATDDRTDWTSALHVLSWSQIQAPSARELADQVRRKGSGGGGR